MRGGLRFREHSTLALKTLLVQTTVPHLDLMPKNSQTKQISAIRHHLLLVRHCASPVSLGIVPAEMQQLSTLMDVANTDSVSTQVFVFEEGRCSLPGPLGLSTVLTRLGLYVYGTNFTFYA